MRNIVNLTNHQYKKVVIGDITIEQDDEGRYCLNDVHKAGGGAITKSPAQWMRHGAFKELQEEIMLKSTINPVETKPGRTGGTYVVKALVYAYAMWISPGFHLKVIEAYDRFVKDGVAVHESAAQDLLINPLKYLQPLLARAQELMEENTRLEQAAEENVPKVEYYEAVKNAVNCQTMEQVAKKYEIGTNRLFKFLRDRKVLRNTADNPPYQNQIESGRFKVEGKEYKYDGKVYLYSQTMVTGKGEIYIGKLLREAGLLPENEAA
ncbi:phage antirepressor KilAC domain-containing protein [Pseudomonas sp. P1.31]|uniref:phage antirepressor KilAC domain-containing protein n=1 Tax=Pseudomonas sp. P1.31 TaxID=1699311 RepID=UPI00069D10E9|nr:phage antirepressor KilAC domain-containing protein [Pseudomonas sp. P1.31]